MGNNLGRFDNLLGNNRYRFFDDLVGTGTNVSTMVSTCVMWVLTGTHLCDDPPRQDGESPKRQLVLCVVASACVVVLLCGRHVRGETCYFPANSRVHKFKNSMIQKTEVRGQQDSSFLHFTFSHFLIFFF